MQETAKLPRLSVIIPCLNEANYLPKLLDDLVEQDIDEPFEVVVADSSSDDGTLDAARQFQNQLDLKTTNTSRMSAGHTRNAGAIVANSEFFLFLDADGRIPHNFLRILMEKRDEYNADMMTTHYTADSWHPFDRQFYYSGSKYFFKPSFERGKPYMSGCVQFVTKKLHSTVGGYKDEITVGEDMDYSERIAKHASRPRFVKELLFKASNRRFKTDGRITMFMRSAKWLGGGNEMDDKRADDFEFGHYGTSFSGKIRIRNLFLEPKLMKQFLRATWLTIRAGFDNIRS